MTTRNNYTTIADGDQLNDGYFNDMSNVGMLGEVKMFAISVTGAVTKATLQTKGWAICDGTTAAAQGIASADITASTPNLDNKFIRSSDNEASGATGGADTKDLSHTHSVPRDGWGAGGGASGRIESNGGAGATGNNTSGSAGSATQDILPAYYELVFFIKVKTTQS